MSALRWILNTREERCTRPEPDWDINEDLDSPEEAEDNDPDTVNDAEEGTTYEELEEDNEKTKNQEDQFFVVFFLF